MSDNDLRDNLARKNIINVTVLMTIIEGFRTTPMEIHGKNNVS